MSTPLAWLWPLSPGRLTWPPDARLFAHNVTPFSQHLLIPRSLASGQSQGHRSSQGPDWVGLLVDLVGFSGEVSVGRQGRTHQAWAVLWGQPWSFVLPSSQSHAEVSRLDSSGSCPGFLSLCPLLATPTTQRHFPDAKCYTESHPEQVALCSAHWAAPVFAGQEFRKGSLGRSGLGSCRGVAVR